MEKYYSISESLRDELLEVLSENRFICDGEDEDNNYDVLDVMKKLELATKDTPS